MVPFCVIDKFWYQSISGTPKSAPSLPQNCPKTAQNLTLPAPELQRLPRFRSNRYWTNFNIKFRPPCFFYKRSFFLPFFSLFLLENDINYCTHELSSNEQLHLLSKNPLAVLFVLSRLLFQATDTCRNTLSYHTRNRPLQHYLRVVYNIGAQYVVQD